MITFIAFIIHMRRLWGKEAQVGIFDLGLVLVTMSLAVDDKHITMTHWLECPSCNQRIEQGEYEIEVAINPGGE